MRPIRLLASLVSSVLVLAAASPAGAQAIRVAVQLPPASTSSAHATAAQLNDDTWFDFDAVVVDASALDTQAELDEFDVLLIGQSGYGGEPADWSVATVGEWSAWSADGRGGVVSIGWMVYGFTSAMASFATAADPIVPFVAPSSNYEFCNAPDATLSGSAHPILDGLATVAVPDTYIESVASPLDAGATPLATTSSPSCTSYPAVVAGSNGAGRLAYLGPIYLGSASAYDTPVLRSGDPDRLLEQAVAWAADSDGDGVWNSQDCDPADGAVGGPSAVYLDDDGDGYGDAPAAAACAPGPGESAVTGDCDDDDPAVHPGATEVCDAGDVDEDCDGGADDLDPGANATGQTVVYADGDGDGFGGATSLGTACVDAGEVTNGLDCDDGDAAVNPAATEEVGDEVDENCDGALLCYLDADSDGARHSSSPSLSPDLDCDEPWEAVASDPIDCHDANGSIHPGATELANGIDDDCDGATDEDLAVTDGDGDGYDEAAGDCQDADDTIHPNAAEVCDGVDQDCDGTVDDGTSCRDDDGDGFSEDDADCDDADPATHPDATETPGNGVDDDCDGVVDETAPSGGGCAATNAGTGSLPIPLVLAALGLALGRARRRRSSTRG